ncbi:DUF4926 domain-containing protein [Pectobacterium carotovorum]|uniref:DUF4926 domain-containing protein n=1 Tax=Pectobacterium brasiliense TaxID=180957 RepID=UPI000B97ACD2|nr:DUF4926 domain-containing protein [Pectobacterium carotovorum]OYN53682.1 DUF4926 domain-containing protein [Pectobacterium carotovorum]
MVIYSLFDVISLKNALPEEGLKKGMLGAIVHIYNEPSPEYEIEFCDDNGDTLACITLTPDCFSKVDFKNSLMVYSLK